MTAQRLQLTWYNKDKALIPTETGKYGYTWVDPSDPRYCETHTLVLDDYVQGAQTPKSDEFAYSERADLEPQDDNLLILGESGDVLEALTRVPELAEKYVGKVKLVYIDPPFNTEKAFNYYEDNLEHSIWLTMMRDRLMHMKKLLADDGSIWIHLDFSENHRMRLLLDEVFSSGSFIGEVTWKKRGNLPNDRPMAANDDKILVYGSEGAFNLRPRPTGHGGYINTDGDPRGPWATHPVDANAKGGRNVEHLRYSIINPQTGVAYTPAAGRNWVYSQEDMERGIRDGRIIFGRTGHSGPVKKAYLSETRAGLTWPTLWLADEIADFVYNNAADKHLQSMFPGRSPFDTPKPEELLERIIHIGSNPGDIVLDVFAGSGTTAAVAQKMGRRWVTCELLESTFTTFTRPRLEKVVNDEDLGGITRTKGERVDATEDGLPDGVSPEDAAKFTSVLNKLIKDDPELKTSAQVKALKAASKTRRTKEVVNWRGGGGFQVAHLSPACFDYDPALDRVMLTAAATGQTLIESVAANLGFTLLHPDDDYVFDARRGNMLLKVVEGVATPEIVDWLASQVQPGETIVLAATSVMDGVRQLLRKAVKGSRVIALPDDVFRYSEGGDQ
ncbi:site-specific DNA-methyltransferase [Arcanobacterium hippocoleae]|uniref:Adenine-specific DNA-methyltransferase n=1 Tax=Arcanobacterium hippocoleae TaxID=149017 RepID=A0ABU1SZZ1_9ACTO|nr:site-specific DNA-methyltransferase [Arcanobacterium hippocoleae]MDR6938667.1 adenine-specific DNA-methyltransferase [Arcanobacterium hippocoleae]